MKSPSRFIAAAAILLATLQTPNAFSQLRSASQGELFNRDIVTIADLAAFAHTTTIYGTARSMGLGGAITSLGGDATSMAVNPAGMAMSRRSEISFTPSINFGNDRTYVGVNNLAATLVFDKSHKGGALMNMNLGAAYTKVADHNYSYGYSVSDSDSSVGYLFSQQLNSAGTSLSDLQGDDYPNWNTLQTYLWSAALGYKGGMTDYSGDAWSPTWLSSTALTRQQMLVESRGSTGDYSLSFSGNVSNKLYFGATISVLSINQSVELLYRETYTDNDLSTSKLLLSDFNQAIKVHGDGVNAKFGITLRPTASLRLGVAYHTPTAYSMTRLYQSSVGTISETDGEYDTVISDSPILEDANNGQTWHFRTQSKLLAGASYTFGQRALLTFDYQRDWYGQVAMTSMPTGVEASLYDGISTIYQSVDTFRFGGEFRVTPALTLRGGYGFSTALLRDDATAADLLGISVMNRSHYLSAGVGYALTKNLSCDITYLNLTRDMSDYTAFYGSSSDAQSGTYSSTLQNHSIAISMSLRL